MLKRDNTPWGATPAALLQWTPSGEPHSGRFDDIYFSREDGAAESRHVFLAGNGLPQRWQRWAAPVFRIAETGFGTGLNFLLSWQAWRALPAPRPRLHYVSFEKFPLGPDELARALAPFDELAELARALVQAWPGRLPGQHRLLLEDGEVLLDLWWEDVAQALPDLASRGPQVDAWYLDGFAPARNDEMWRETLYPYIAALSRPGATFSTFTAAGQVRRGLAAAGFEVRKVPGYGRKRESLVGRIAAPGAAMPWPDTPWDLPEQMAQAPASALVLGAGLAGCALARALALRGVRVSLLERGDIAGQASGNSQGILYTRLSRRHSALNDFALQSFRHAATRYAQWFASGGLASGVDGELCGMFHLEEDPGELAALADALDGLEEFAQVTDRVRAAQLLGVEPALDGLWLPASGWLNPPAVCRALVAHPLIELRTGCGELALAREQDHWIARDSHAAVIARAPVAAICAATGSRDLPGLEWLPLRAIPGQTTVLPQSAATAALRAAVCHRGYIAPASGGAHCIGASFRPNDPGLDLREPEHRENLDNLAAALPGLECELAGQPLADLAGRVGVRCTSPDYLPLAGPVPERADFLHSYAALRKNARQPIPRRGSYMPGLYLNAGHGSRGLSSTPLCAELLASMICGEPLPLSRELARALSPARFLIRDLSRNRI